MPCGCALPAYVGLWILDGRPRTLRFEITNWQNQSWGLHNIDRLEARCEVAIAGDGSRSKRCASETFRYYFVPNGHWAMHSLYKRPESTGFEIDDTARSASGGPCACTWELHRLEVGDPDCATSANRILGAGKPMGAGLTAGQRVLHSVTTTEDGEQQQVSLAPALDCEVMEVVHTCKGTFGIPGAKWRYAVTSYVSGEPDASYFQIPAGYSLRKPRP